MLCVLAEWGSALSLLRGFSQIDHQFFPHTVIIAWSQLTQNSENFAGMFYQCHNVRTICVGWGVTICNGLATQLDAGSLTHCGFSDVCEAWFTQSETVHFTWSCDAVVVLCELQYFSKYYTQRASENSSLSINHFDQMTVPAVND